MADQHRGGHRDNEDALGMRVHESRELATSQESLGQAVGGGGGRAVLGLAAHGAAIF